MSEFTRAIRKQIIRETTVQPFRINPLLALGFSPVLFNIGLSDDELYDTLYRYARGILSLFHEDRTGNSPMAVEKQRQYAQIFEQIKSRETFNLALQELRDRKSDEQSERNEKTRTLLEKIEASRVDRETLQIAKTDRAQAIADRNVLLAKAKLRLDWQCLHPVRSGSYRQAIHRIEAVHRVLVMSVVFEGSKHGPREDRVPSICRRFSQVKPPRVLAKLPDDEFQAAEYRRKVFLDELRRHTLGNTETKKLVEQAMKSKCSFPIIDWNEEHGFARYPLEDLIGRKVTTPSIYEWQSLRETLGLSDGSFNQVFVGALSHRYRQCMEYVFRVILRHMPYTRKLVIEPKVLEIERGNFRDDQGQQVILGSILSDDIDEDDLDGFLIKREAEEMKGLPFLLVGQSIIAARPNQNDLNAITTPEQIRNFLNFRAGRKHSSSVRYTLLHVLE